MCFTVSWGISLAGPGLTTMPSLCSFALSEDYVFQSQVLWLVLLSICHMSESPDKGASPGSVLISLIDMGRPTLIVGGTFWYQCR